MKNDIAKLITAYDEFWRDMNSLINDIEYIVVNKHKWSVYEYKKVENGCYYRSFYNKNNLLYIYYDLTDDTPYLQIDIFYISDEEDENEIGLNYLDEHWKGADPAFFLLNKNYEIEDVNNGFSVIQDSKEKYIFSPRIDFMSITSSEVVDTDINNLISMLIAGSYDEYKPLYVSYAKMEENTNNDFPHE